MCVSCVYRKHALGNPAAESSLDLLQLLGLTDPASLSLPPFAFAVLLYQFADPLATICLLVETERDWLSWGMALRAHMRHYFHAAVPEELDADDDPEAPPAGVSPPPVLIRGHGKKEARGYIKTWKQRYFVLEAGVLNYYETPVDIYPYGVNKRGDINLASYTVKLSHNVRKNAAHHSDTAASPDDAAALEFFSAKQKENFVIVLDNATVDEVGNISTSKDTWFSSLQAHIEYAKSVR